jgi:hypothetical protein
MYNNDRHRKILSPDQQYTKLYVKLNGELKPNCFLELDWVVIWRGDDSEAPTAPGAPSVASNKQGTVTLKWKPSTDNLMVQHYEVLAKEGEDFKRVTLATAAWATLPATEFKAGTYAIRAVDVAGNKSKPSPSAELTP